MYSYAVLWGVMAALLRFVPYIGSRPRLGFKSFWTARCTIAGIEVRHAIRKGQWLTQENTPATPAEYFSALAAQITISEDRAHLYLNFATKPS